MYKKIISLCVAIFIVVIMVSGCSNSLKDENVRLIEEITAMKEKNSELEKSVAKLTEESKNLNDKLMALEAKEAFINEEISKHKDSVYPIYSADVNTYAKEIHFGTYIPGNLSIKNKLEAIANALSEVYFSNLPIEVSEITEISGKKIAVINLKESEENQKINDASQFKGASWATRYFQGSTGGIITSICLIETFLQKDYEGQWIDGVKFLYNNKVCDFQHVPSLGEVSYRK